MFRMSIRVRETEIFGKFEALEVSTAQTRVCMLRVSLFSDGFE